MMTRIIAILIAAVLAVSLAACSGDNAASYTDSTAEQTQAATTADNADSPADNNTASSGSKTLIVYFSPANADTADAISSATPRVGDASSVEYVAQLINNKVGADMAKIVPKDAYPTGYEDTADLAKEQRDAGERPEFTLDVDPTAYDAIFVGYPIWWYELPMIMQTFFDSYDLRGKTIIPFNTHEGSADGGTYDQIKELEPNATVIDGLAIRGGDVGDAESKVNEWLSGIGY